MEAKDILQELEAAMRQLCEVKNKLRKVAAMLTPEHERQPDLFTAMGLTKETMEEKIKEVREQEAKTCKTCGFYENNCPYIRGRFMPYPSRVCEDYTYSVMKEQEQEPQRRTWKKLTVQMKDTAIVAAEKVGRKSGWCRRSDIERSLQRRNPERSREDIREAVNAAVDELGLTCVKYNSYRFYRTSDSGRIIARSLAKLCVA